MKWQKRYRTATPLRFWPLAQHRPLCQTQLLLVSLCRLLPDCDGEHEPTDDGPNLSQLEHHPYIDFDRNRASRHQAARVDRVPDGSMAGPRVFFRSRELPAPPTTTNVVNGTQQQQLGSLVSQIPATERSEPPTDMKLAPLLLPFARLSCYGFPGTRPQSQQRLTDAKSSL